MAVAASEQIMQALVTRLETLMIPNLVIEQDENPDFGAARYIYVAQGVEANQDLDQFGTGHTRVTLDISLIVGVGSLAVGERLRTVLSDMVAKVKEAIREDDTLGGLCFLRWISNIPGDPTEEEGLPRQNVITMEWQADYTHQYDDPYIIYFS
jgi:hypothetical protein